MAAPQELAQYAIKSYRYLRLVIVVVVLALIASMLTERTKTSCWQVSFSAYYYTPVHAIFVGALVTIGAALIAVKGSTEWEDMLLNVSGILAPVVAFVPTSRPVQMCTSSEFGAVDAEAYIDNNVLALAIGGAVAVGAALLIAKLQKKVEFGTIDVPTRVGLLLSSALTIAGLVWYFGFRDSFLDHAHSGAAIAMFVIVGVVIAINARHARKGYRGVYAGLAGFMAASIVGVIVANLVVDEWRHSVLWLEILELVPFAVFWGAQTLELWDGGVRSSDS